MESSRARSALFAALLLGAVPVPMPAPGQAGAHSAHAAARAAAPGQVRVAAGGGGAKSAARSTSAAGPLVASGSSSPKAQSAPRSAPAQAAARPAAIGRPLPAPAPAQGPVARPAVRGGLALPAPAPAPVPTVREDGPPVAFPTIVLPPGPEAQRLEIVLFALPLLLAIWLWALVRLSVAAWSQRGATVRATLAHQLGLRTQQLAALDIEGLRRLRDGIAFDELTGVLRRAAGLAGLEREVARAAREGQPLSVAFIDIDGLKAANDVLGHAAGDALLRGVAGVLTRRLRAQDLVFRYGGDEFVCVIPATSRPRAEAIVAEMRQSAVADGLSFSFGVAQANPGETARSVIARADSLQYLDKQARRTGRLGPSAT